MRRTFRVLGRTLLFTLLAPLALPHGGVYRGPGATVPPGPVAPPAGGGAGGSGGATGGPASADPTDWSTWWGFHRDPYIDLRRKIHDTRTVTEGDDFYLGRGQKAKRTSLRPTDDQLFERVAPALRRVLAEERNDDLITAALVGLAKIGDPPAGTHTTGAPVSDVLRPFLAHPNQEVSETAAVALGILASDRSVFLLAELLHDTEAGRKAVDEREVPWRTRAFAAYGLGLVGAATEREEVRRFIVHKLAGAFEADTTATEDVRIACVLAMGRVPLERREPEVLTAEDDDPPAPSSSREAQLRWLLDVFADPRGDDLVRSHVPTSLGRLVADEDGPAKALVIRELLPSVARFSRAWRAVRTGVTTTLGVLADADSDPEDVAAREALLRLLKEDEVLVRSLARIAIARAAARPGTGDGSEETLADVRGRLLRQLASGTSLRRPWAALALAVLERERARQGFAVEPEIAAAMREALADSASQDESAGHCVALGVLRDPLAEAGVRATFEELRVDGPRGHAAIALGMIGAGGAGPMLRAELERSRFRPSLIRDIAIGLALVGDKDAVPALLELLGTAKSLSSQAAVATALGNIGDQRAVDGLLALLFDDSLSDRARAFVAAALGIVGDKHMLPWNVGYAVDVNYPAAVPTLTDGVGKGILDIL